MRRVKSYLLVLAAVLLTACNGIKIPYSIKPRRAGDIAICYSDPAKAYCELGWKAQYGLEEMCRDSWNWQKNNPNGY